MNINSTYNKKTGFSLIEVVLAIGIFLVTVLALVGLLGPTLQSVDEVEKTDEVSSIVNTVNAFLQNSPTIAGPNASKFNAIYTAVAGDADNSATMLVFRQYDASDNISLKIGFLGETQALVTAADIGTAGNMLAAGPIYRVILTPSSVNPDVEMNIGAVGDYPRYKMKKTDPTQYPEGYFAMEVRIFAEESSTIDLSADPADYADVEPIFTYNTAIVR